VSSSPDIPEKEIRERCSSILSGAADEARRLGHNYIGTEHLFIAATRNENGPTSTLLRRAGLSPRHVRNEIRREVGAGEGLLDRVLPITPRTEMVLALSIFLAEQEEEEDVNENHLLMALLQEGEGVPIRKLIDMGFDLNLWLQRLIAEEHGAIEPGIPDDSGLFDFLNSDDDFDMDEDVESSQAVAQGAKVRVPNSAAGQIRARPHPAGGGWPHRPAVARRPKSGRWRGRWRGARRTTRSCWATPEWARRPVVEGWPIPSSTAYPRRSLRNRRIVQIEIRTLVARTACAASSRND
jgi:hypothetical protein